jgi:hypothetical protein
VASVFTGFSCVGGYAFDAYCFAVFHFLYFLDCSVPAVFWFQICCHVCFAPNFQLFLARLRLLAMTVIAAPISSRVNSKGLGTFRLGPATEGTVRTGGGTIVPP